MGSKRKERHTSGFDPDEYPDELERLEALRRYGRDKLGRGLYPDPDYPLWDGQTSPHGSKLTPERRDKQFCHVEGFAVRRLKKAYEHAKERDGITLAEWAAKCSNHGKDKNAARRWLESPSTMERSEVLATCELFGCSLAYLQGREWDAERVIEVYEVLSTESRVKLCSYLGDLDELEWLLRPDEYRRAAARVAAERRAAKGE